VQLVNLGILGRDEMEGVNDTLDAAALTYVAAFVATSATCSTCCSCSAVAGATATDLPVNPAAHGVLGTNTGPAAAGNGARRSFKS